MPRAAMRWVAVAILTLDDSRTPSPRQHKLLTAAEEVDLAKAIEGADLAAWTWVFARPAMLLHAHDLMLKRWTDAPLPADATAARRTDPDREVLLALARASDPKRAELRRLLHAGQPPRDRFVAANHRLVISVALRYFNNGMSTEDLIQEGTLGLMAAVSRFDHRLGFRFSTYAVNWIRQGIGRAIDNTSRAVRLPVGCAGGMRAVGRTVDALERRLGRSPTDDEIAGALSVTPKRLAAMRGPGYALSGSSRSLNAPVKNGSVSALDRLADPNPAAPPIDGIIAQAARLELKALLAALPKREATVLAMRFGLDTAHGLGLKEIGEHFELSRERIRQIEMKALATLRHRIGKRPGARELLEALV